MNTVSVLVECDQDLPIAIISDPPVLNPGTSVQLDASTSSAGSEFSYIWSTDDGNIVSGENSLVPIVDQPGTYCLTVVNVNNGCENSTCVQVEQSATSTLVADAGPDIIIDCTTTVINTTIGGPNTSVGDSICYTWVNDFTQQVISDSMTAVITDFGFYILTVLDKTTNETAMDTVQFVENLIVPTISVNVTDILTCQDTIVDITVIGNDTYDYSWTTNGGNIVSDPNEKDIQVDAPGEYQLVASDPTNGCFTSISVIVEQDVETGIVTGPTTISCGPLDLLLDFITKPGNFSYAWLPQEGLEIIDDLQVRISLSGTYTLVQTNLDTGCEVLYLFNIEIADPFEIDLGPDIEVDCSVFPIVLGVENLPIGGIYDYSWFGPGGFSSNQMQISVEIPGTYTLTATDLNSGCLASDEITIAQSTPPISILSSTIDWYRFSKSRESSCRNIYHRSY